jgi:hypothetical protein
VTSGGTRGTRGLLLLLLRHACVFQRSSALHTFVESLGAQFTYIGMSTRKDNRRPVGKIQTFKTNRTMKGKRCPGMGHLCLLVCSFSEDKLRGEKLFVCGAFDG